MNSKLAICAAFTAVAAVSTSASAATVICEAGGPANADGVSCSSGVLPDFSNDISAPTVLASSITGDTAIYGVVVEGYADAWTMDLGDAIYDVFVSFTPTTSDFTATLLVDEAAYGSYTAVSGEENSFYVGQATGTLELAIDATSGETLWDVSLSAVPLPGASVLLLGALGAMGVAARSRKSGAATSL